MVGGRTSLSLLVACALVWAACSQERAPQLPGQSLLTEAKLDLTPVSRIGRGDEPKPTPDLAPPPLPLPPDHSADYSRLLASAAAYQKGDLSAGDALASAVDDPLQRVALEWIALRTSAHPDYARLAAFGAAHPEWAANPWIRYQQEAALYTQHARPEIVRGLFAVDPPRTPAGKLALARTARAGGDDEQAA